MTTSQADKRRREAAECRCVHFTGVQHEACRAGVNYDDVVARSRSIKDGRYPCLYPPHERCASYEATGAGRAAEKAQGWGDLVRYVFSVRGELVLRMNTMQCESASAPCPKCRTGTVNGHRNTNGHVHAACTTEGCLSWME